MQKSTFFKKMYHLLKRHLEKIGGEAMLVLAGCLVFYPIQNLHLVTSSEGLVTDQLFEYHNDKFLFLFDFFDIVLTILV